MGMGVAMLQRHDLHGDGSRVEQDLLKAQGAVPRRNWPCGGLKTWVRSPLVDRTYRLLGGRLEKGGCNAAPSDAGSALLPILAEIPNPDLRTRLSAILQSRNGGTHMANTTFARLGTLLAASFLAAVLSALSGCAALHAQRAAGTEELLTAAGFQKRPADSADQARNLASMPPFKLVVRGMGGDVAYTYADPVNCRCLYIGGPKEYVKYQRLATERDIEESDLWAEDDRMDWGLWGGGGWLR